MNQIWVAISRFSVLALVLLSSTQRARAAEASNSDQIIVTNGAAVFRLRIQGFQVMPGPPVSYSPPSLDLPVEIRRSLMTFRAAQNITVYTNLERVLDHYQPDSLNNLIWTNFIAHTNGRNMLVWSERAHPPGWPGQPPVLRWNPTSLMWGMRGMTALSPCWELEGNPGMTPITALTRRHGYSRGHSMGVDRVGNRYAGSKVWFLTSKNAVVEMTVAREIVRTMETSGRDYSILLFSSDLPDEIQPMRVCLPAEVFAGPHSRYAYFPEAPCPCFQTEETGNVSAGTPGFSCNTGKGGDSGSPNMLPFPGELVFASGRSTSGASQLMQADMDQLCRLEGLDPAKYQLQWIDLSSYPSY